MCLPTVAEGGGGNIQAIAYLSAGGYGWVIATVQGTMGRMLNA